MSTDGFQIEGPTSSSNKAVEIATGVAVVAGITGGVYAAKCGGSGFSCASCCIKAGLAFATAAVSWKAASDASRFGNQFNTNPYGNGNPYGDGDPNNNNNNGRNPFDVAADATNEEIDRLRDHGYDVDLDNGNVTTPDGRTFSASDMGDKGKLMEKGMKEWEAKQSIKDMNNTQAMAAAKQDQMVADFLKKAGYGKGKGKALAGGDAGVAGGAKSRGGGFRGLGNSSITIDDGGLRSRPTQEKRRQREGPDAGFRSCKVE